MNNLEKLNFIISEKFKVQFWNAETKDEKYAQNNFIGRIVSAIAVDIPGAVAAKILDWQIDTGDGNKTSLRTVIRWNAHDFADLKARIDALSQQTGHTSQGLTKDEYATIYRDAVTKALPAYEIREIVK